MGYTSHMYVATCLHLNGGNLVYVYVYALEWRKPRECVYFYIVHKDHSDKRYATLISVGGTL